MIQRQEEYDYALAWIREMVGPEIVRYERSQTVAQKLERFDATMMDVINALRTAQAIVERYEVHCYVVRGFDLQGEIMHVVVAPPSEQNRIRIVNFWF